MENIRLDMNDKQKTLAMIYERTYAKAYVIAKQFVKNEEDALDIVQEAYISVFNHMESLQDESKLDKWVNMIVANRCKDWLRKRQVVLFSDMGEDENSDYEETLENDNVEFLPEESVDYAETKRLMSEILAGLPEDQRMCVLMYYYDELSVNEIADSLECSTGTIKSRLNYARKKIKDEVEALERKGTKLYGIAPLPFIVWMLKGTETHAASALNHTTIVQSAMGTGSGVIGKAGVMKQVANASRKAVVHGVRNKILAIGLTACLIGGSVFGVKNCLDRDNEKQSNVPQQSEEQKQSSEEGLSEEILRAQAYYDQLLEYEEEYGTTQILPASNNAGFVLTGVCFAQLIDMNNDGKDELIIAYGEEKGEATEKTIDHWIEIWRYELPNRLVQMHVDAQGGYWFTAEGLNSVAFLEKEEKFYYVEGKMPEDGTYKIFGYKDDDVKMVKKLTRNTENGYSTTLDSVCENDRFYVDNKSVAAETYFAEENEWLNGDMLTYPLSAYLENQIVGTQRELEATRGKLEAILGIGPKIEQGYLLYEDILEEYYTTFNEADDSFLYVEEIGVSIYSNNPMSEIGYQFIDVNNDGVYELFIGDIDSRGEYIIDGYWYYRGETHAMTDHMNNDNLRLHNDIICSSGSMMGLSYTSYIKIKPDGSGTEVVESVLADTVAGETTYSHTDSDGNKKNTTAEEIQKVQSKYKTTSNIEYIPFKNYTDKIIAARVDYVEQVYQTIEENLDTYTKEDSGYICYYYAPNLTFNKVVYQPPEGMYQIEGYEDYLVEYYYDGRDGKIDWQVLTIATNVKTGEVYKYYEYDDQLIRYVHCNGKTYDYENGECYVDTTTKAYGLYKGGFWD